MNDRCFQLCVLVVIFFAATFPSGAFAGSSGTDTFVPLYDFAGQWTDDSDPGAGHNEVTRDGKHVIDTFNTAAYEHIFQGDYIDDHTIEGTQQRRNRADGTATRMYAVITMLSHTRAQINWMALDSYPGLTLGQTGVGFNTRLSGTSISGTSGSNPTTGGTSGTSGTFVPTYDFSGHWVDTSNPSAGQTNTTRVERHVTSVYNITGYDHLFEGDYTDDHTIVGIQTRHKLSDNSTARMSITFTMLSNDYARINWVVIESNSDVGVGESGVAYNSRVAGTSGTGTPPPDPTEPFTPKYDFSGHWIDVYNPSAGQTDTTRLNRHVTSLYNIQGFEHTFEGDYTDDHTIVGIQTRYKVADGSSTRMSITFTMLSNDFARIDWVALDSNSDLQAGQSGLDYNARVVSTTGTTGTSGTGGDPKGPFVPDFDFAGRWLDDADFSSPPAEITRAGRHITEFYDTPGYEHIFEGDYTDGHTIVGVQKRRNRADGLTTRMSITVTMLSSDRAKIDWVALDSDSDLPAGSSGTDYNTRVADPEDPLAVDADSDTSFHPTYEIRGRWKPNDAVGVSNTYRNGRNVKSYFTSPGLRAVLTGKYINANTIRGTETRKRLSDGTKTRRAVVITFLSRNRTKVNWMALDAAANHTIGQAGVRTESRVGAK